MASARTGLSIRDFLLDLREAGVGSLPGTAAEILDDEVRWVLTKGKLPTSQWIEVVTHRPRGGPAHDVDDDVRPRRPAGALGPAPEGDCRHPALDRRLHRVRAAAVRPPVEPDLSGRRRPAGPDRARQPGRSRDVADHAARADRQHPVLVGQARAAAGRAGARRRSERPRRHAHGGDHQPDGRLDQRFQPRPGRARGDRRGRRTPGPAAHQSLRSVSTRPSERSTSRSRS